MLNATRPVPDCVFCHIPDWRVFWNNQAFCAILDAAPVTPGHLLIIPFRHLTRVDEFYSSGWARFHEALMAVPSALTEVILTRAYRRLVVEDVYVNTAWFCQRALERLERFKWPPQGCNWGWNQGEVAGQTVAHFHIHGFPRWPEDVEDSVGGVRQIFGPYLGNYRLLREK